MKNLMVSIVVIAGFAACTNNASAPLQTDMVILTPRNKIHVYTDEHPIKKLNKKQNIVQHYTKTAKNHTINAANPIVAIKTASITAQTLPINKEDTSSIPADIPANTQSSDADTVRVKEESVFATKTSAPIKKEKKGWSNAAKGTVIGGVGGAVGGAVISKNKSKGAIIGGIIGATGGYIYGKTMDKKDEQNDY